MQRIYKVKTNKEPEDNPGKRKLNRKKPKPAKGNLSRNKNFEGLFQHTEFSGSDQATGVIVYGYRVRCTGVENNRIQTEESE